MNAHHQGPSSSRGLALVDWATLTAILVVVLVVSLPRLHSHTLHQNERDAIQAARMLGKSVFAMESAPALAELLKEDRSLEHRLEDVEVLEQGRVLRRHGYLFDITHTASGATALRAWPWNCGETGYGAFILRSDGELLGHPNKESRWSGPGHAPATPARQGAAPGWRPIED